MFEKFTDNARKIYALANQEAQRFHHEYIGTEHILLGITKHKDCTASIILKDIDIDSRKIRLEIEKTLKSGPDMVTMGKLPQTPRAKKIAEFAIDKAREMKLTTVGSEHILLGLLLEKDGVAAQVLTSLGATCEKIIPLCIYNRNKTVPSSPHTALTGMSKEEFLEEIRPIINDFIDYDGDFNKLVTSLEFHSTDFVFLSAIKEMRNKYKQIKQPLINLYSSIADSWKEHNE
tara:strand:- start:5850 stop:6545 length:696 start_codon:yes stop_codon:yes gene_type:complete